MSKIKRLKRLHFCFTSKLNNVHVKKLLNDYKIRYMKFIAIHSNIHGNKLVRFMFNYAY